MDYIQEEFLRQRTALEALMGGGSANSVRQGEAVPEEIPQPAASAVTAVEAVQAGKRTTLAMAEAIGGAGRVAQQTADVKNTSVSRRGNAVDRTYFTGDTFAAAEDTATLSGSFYTVSVAEQTAAAQKLSRAIQRDARRYDGGFSIY